MTVPNFLLFFPEDNVSFILSKVSNLETSKKDEKYHAKLLFKESSQTKLLLTIRLSHKVLNFSFTKSKNWMLSRASFSILLIISLFNTNPFATLNHLFFKIDKLYHFDP